MPVYEYLCEDCDTKFEELIRSDSDEETLTCSHCKSASVVRLFSAFGFSSGNSFVSSSENSGGCSSCSSHNCSSCN